MTAGHSRFETFSSGQLANLAGVSTDTLRHYERKGVLSKPDRSSNGYRIYRTDALQRVHLIRGALAVGFTLDELAAFLKARAQGNPPSREVRALAGKKLNDVDEQISMLKAIRLELSNLIEQWDERLLAAPATKEARLLEILSATQMSKSTPIRRSTRSIIRKARK